jgi:hypothetical protein
VRLLFERELRITPGMIANRVRREWVVQPRSKGYHVQACNKVLGIAAKKLSDSEGADYPFDRFSNTHYPLMPALGLSWEELRASLYSEDELIWQPGELERDGVYGTPDGLAMTDEMFQLGVACANWECKQTTARIKSITDCWMYVRQGMSYCAMNGLRHVLYDICWGMGDYQRPIQPRATTALVEFSDDEVERWWKNILSVIASGAVKAE